MAVALERCREKGAVPAAALPAAAETVGVAAMRYFELAHPVLLLLLLCLFVFVCARACVCVSVCVCVCVCVCARARARVCAIVTVLLVQRWNNYVFSVDRALEIKGNTYVYVSYAVSRVRVRGCARSYWRGAPHVALCCSATRARACECVCVCVCVCVCACVCGCSRVHPMVTVCVCVLARARVHSALRGLCCVLQLQNANANTPAQSVREKLGEGAWAAALCAGPPADGDSFVHPSERALALAVARVGDGAAGALARHAPHELCASLYALAGALSDFYNRCRIIGGANVGVRVRLCAATDAALRAGLGLLGCEPQDTL